MKEEKMHELAEKFRIRASCASKIMTEPKGAAGLTGRQAEELKKLEEREKLTEKQAIKKAELIAKRDKKPELSATAKGYCQEWLKSKLYDKTKEIKSKYLEKGNEVEDKSIEFLSRVLDVGLEKNETWFQDDWMHGTPDVIPDHPSYWDKVIDMKNSWDCFTFPLFYPYNTDPKKAFPAYYWQGIVYMNLTGRTEYEIIYTLMDAPQFLQEREAKQIAYGTGVDYEETLKEVEEQLTFSHLPDHLRLKRFPFALNPHDVVRLQQRVIMCREYIDQLLKESGL